MYHRAHLTHSIACLQVRADIAMTIAGITLYHVVPSRSCRVLWLLNVGTNYPLHMLRRAPAHLPVFYRVNATCMRMVIACSAMPVEAFSALHYSADQ